MEIVEGLLTDGRAVVSRVRWLAVADDLSAAVQLAVMPVARALAAITLGILVVAR